MHSYIVSKGILFTNENIQKTATRHNVTCTTHILSYTVYINGMYGFHTLLNKRLHVYIVQENPLTKCVCNANSCNAYVHTSYISS